MKRFFNGLLLAFAFSIPLSSYLSVRVLILLVIVSFFYKESDLNFKTFIIKSWDLMLYLLVLVVGLFHSADQVSALRILETNFSVLAMPIIFYRVQYFDGKRLNNVFHFFIIGLFIACTICLANASIFYFQTGDIQVFFFYRLTNVISSHPTYFAYYLIFSITFALYNLSNEKTPVKPILAALIILFFFLILLLTSGQTAFISLLLVFSYFILKFFLGDRSNNQKLIIGIVVMMMANMFFISSTQNSKREDNLNDSWDRFALWGAAIEANPNVLLGVGTGDSKIVLNEYFTQHNLSEYAKDNLNSHNQLIQSYLSNGLVGLFALMLMLGRPLYISFKSNNAFGILVFFPFLIYGMTEVFFGRYQGIVFFALLHQIFVSYHASTKPVFSLKEA